MKKHDVPQATEPTPAELRKLLMAMAAAGERPPENNTILGRAYRAFRAADPKQFAGESHQRTSLSIETITTRDALVEQFRIAIADLHESIRTYNETVTEAWDEVEICQNIVNDVTFQANLWQAEIRDELDEYIHGWRRGDNAEFYEQWQSDYVDDINRLYLPEPTLLYVGADVNHPADYIARKQTSLRQRKKD